MNLQKKIKKKRKMKELMKVAVDSIYEYRFSGNVRTLNDVYLCVFIYIFVNINMMK